MKDEQFNDVSRMLSELGIFVEGDGFRTKDAITGRKRYPNRDMLAGMFAGAGVEAKDYIEEWKKRRTEETARSAADAMESARAALAEVPAHLSQRYSETRFISPALERMTSWSEADRKVFARFGFASNPSDGTLVLVIDNGDGTWAVVPFGRNAMFALADISAKCSRAKATDPRYPNLYEEMTSGFKDLLARAVEAWENADDDDRDAAFVRGLGMNIPHSMLKRLHVQLTVEKVKYEVQTPEGARSSTVQVPRCACLVYPGKAGYVEPLEFMVRYPGDLVAHDEMKRPMPKVYTNDPSEPALCYIDLETICEDGPCPTWDKYLARYTADEGMVIAAFIWGILDAGNGGRQMLYIYDPKGFSAKSAMLNCIIECLGEHMCIAIQKDSLNNQFSLAKVWDKRLVTYADNKNTKLLMSEKMHMMTGHDYADIEMKGKNSFHAKLQCKVIASGNAVLEIHPDARHEVTRAIIVKPRMTDELYREFCALNPDGSVKRRPDGEPVILGDPTFEKNLKKEFRRFLTRCRESYRKLCPTRSDIQLPASMYDELMSYAPTETYTMADFFDTFYEAQEGAMIPVREFRDRFSDFRLSYADTGRDAPLKYEDFVEYVRKKYNGVAFGTNRYYNGAKTRVVVGLKFRESAV